MKFQGTQSAINSIFLILLFMGSLPLSGQNSNLMRTNSLTDYKNTEAASIIARQTKYLKNLYSGKIEVPKELINGKEYEPYYLRSIFKPLLLPGKERTASVLTNSRRYNGLTLQYDTFLDEVIFTDTSKILNLRYPQIALNKDIVDGFNLYFGRDSLIFRNFRTPECSEKNLKEGFYEVVYNKASEYLIKHESSFYQRQGLDNYMYSPKNFISTGGKFNRIKGRKSILVLFGEKSHEVKTYMHSSGIKMRRADKDEIVSILKFYDSLLKPE